MRSLAALLVLLAGCASRPSPVAPPARAPTAARPDAPKPAPMVMAAEPAPEPATAPAPQPDVGYVPTAADQVFAHRMLDVIDEIAAVMEHRQDDCDRMAADLELVAQRNQDLIVAGKQMKGNPARDKWFQQQAMGRLEKALGRMMAGFQKCQNNARLQALFRKLGS